VADVMTLTTTGTLSTATINATTLTGTLSTASQPNITTLAGLTSIRGQTIATTAWQYVNGLNQQVSTTSSPTFTNITGVTTFTPATFTVTPGAGAISGPVVNMIKYTRVGGVIQMNGNIVFTQITTPASSWTIVVSVPRSANFSSTFQAIGNGVIVNSATVNSTGNITANIGAQTITLSLITSIAVLGTYTVVFNSQYDF
jgi:hypothetical protein